MNKRMSWIGDERLYQPRMHSRHIRRIHQISQASGYPMTVLIDAALEALIDTCRQTPPINTEKEQPS